MAFPALLGSALATAAAVWLAFPSDMVSDKTFMRMLRYLARSLRGIVQRISRTSLVEILLDSDDAALAACNLGGWLSDRGVACSSSESASVLLLIACASILCGIFLAGSWLGAVVGIGACALGIETYAARIRRVRTRALSSEMPVVFRSLAVSLGSGLTLSQAIAYVGSREESVAAPAFAHCSLKLICGEPYEEALEDLSRELDTPGAGLLSSALAISHQTGSPLQGLFMRSARLVERAGELERLLAVKTAQVRLSVRVVCLLPVVLVGLLLIISPDFQKGVATPAGLISLGLACCMDVAAVLIVRHLSRGIL